MTQQHESMIRIYDILVSCDVLCGHRFGRLSGWFGGVRFIRLCGIAVDSSTWGGVVSRQSGMHELSLCNYINNVFLIVDSDQCK